MRAEPTSGTQPGWPTVSNSAARHRLQAHSGSITLERLPCVWLGLLHPTRQVQGMTPSAPQQAGGRGARPVQSPHNASSRAGQFMSLAWLEGDKWGFMHALAHHCPAFYMSVTAGCGLQPLALPVPGRRWMVHIRCRGESVHNAQTGSATARLAQAYFQPPSLDRRWTAFRARCGVCTWRQDAHAMATASPHPHWLQLPQLQWRLLTLADLGAAQGRTKAKPKVSSLNLSIESAQWCDICQLGGTRGGHCSACATPQPNMRST